MWRLRASITSSFRFTRSLRSIVRPVPGEPGYSELPLRAASMNSGTVIGSAPTRATSSVRPAQPASASRASPGRMRVGNTWGRINGASAGKSARHPSARSNRLQQLARAVQQQQALAAHAHSELAAGDELDLVGERAHDRANLARLERPVERELHHLLEHAQAPDRGGGVALGA